MPSYDKFLNVKEGFNQDILGGSFDIDNVGGKSLLLPNKDAAKKMLMMRNPDITKEQADMMFDSEKELMDKEEQREKKRREKEEQRALSREERKAISDAEKEKKRQEREARNAKRKEERKQRIKKYKELYKAKIEELKKEAKNLKQTIKDALHKLWEGFKDLIKRIYQAIVKTGAAIAGISVVITAPPWNVPNGIDQLMNVIENYLNVLKAIKELKPQMHPFDMIPLVTDKKSLRIIASIFNPLIKGLRLFYKPIKFMNQLITKALDWLGKFLKSRRESIFRKATRKLKKLGHLYRFWFIHPNMKGEKDLGIVSIPFPFLPGTIRGDYYGVGSRPGVEYPCYAFEEEDLDEIQGLLDTFICGFTRDKSRNRVVAYRRKFTKEAKDLAILAGKGFGDEIDFASFDFEAAAKDFADVDNSNTGTNLLATAGITETVGDVSDDDINLDVQDSFIYDIELPDGSIIQNITEEGIEYYRQNYLLKYLNAATQSYQIASSLA